MKTLLFVFYLCLYSSDAPTLTDTSRQEAQAETGPESQELARNITESSALLNTTLDQYLKPESRKRSFEYKKDLTAKKRFKKRKIDYGGAIFTLLLSLAFFGLGWLIRLNTLSLLIFGLNLLLHLLIAFFWTISIKKRIKNDRSSNSSELWLDWGVGLILLSLFFIATSLLIFYKSIVAFDILGGLALLGVLYILFDLESLD